MSRRQHPATTAASTRKSRVASRPGALPLRLELGAEPNEPEAVVARDFVAEGQGSDGHSRNELFKRSSTVTPRRDAGGYCVEWQMLGACIGQRAEQHLPVVLGDDPAVEKYDGAVVGLRPNEPAKALTQPQRGLRQLKLHERVLVTLGSALNERIVGDTEGQPDDHDAAQGV